ncbi:hypothetical protein VNI00_009738 [Paramarasmius palmivorus]|uniref:NAD(P)-binding protein n=1 Tax=Paramarasmius palmivorus TaxID=297713 RepID=A0AAW0CNR8_9AGAR
MIAGGFAQNGAKVYIASRKESQLKEAVAELSKNATGSVHYIVGNVGSKAGCDALISEFKKRESKLHVLVNNSGITWGGSYDDFPEEKGWDNVFNVNVKSIFYMTAGLTNLLIKDSNSYDPGRVINISSTASVEPGVEGFLSAPGNGTWSYQPSKAAVNHLTSVLAVKLGPQHVTFLYDTLLRSVNAILPGLFPSKMTAYGMTTVGEETFNSIQPTGQSELPAILYHLTDTVIGRFGTPQDMAGLALFLASPASAHVTGVHILLDGGSRYIAQKITPATKL